MNGRNETGRDVWLESLALIHTTDESSILGCPAGKKRNPNTFQVVITHNYPMV